VSAATNYQPKLLYQQNSPKPEIRFLWKNAVQNQSLQTPVRNDLLSLTTHITLRASFGPMRFQRRRDNGNNSRNAQGAGAPLRTSCDSPMFNDHWDLVPPYLWAHKLAANSCLGDGASCVLGQDLVLYGFQQRLQSGKPSGGNCFLDTIQILMYRHQVFQGCVSKQTAGNASERPETKFQQPRL